MGCKAVTPHLVSLAKKLEGRPFHLVATHCQNNPKEEVISYLKSQKLPADQPNVTVTSFGGHPKVKGNGYVPYYMVFDHTGKLIHHHMCGAYHGGDGLKMIEWVEKLLANTPEIYLGKEPFTTPAALAKQIAAKKRMAAAILKVEAGLVANDQDEELKRLHARVEEYRDRRMASAKEAMGSHPKETLPALKTLQKEFKGTALGEDVSKLLSEMKKSRELKDSIAVARKFAKLKKRLDRLPSCKACKRRHLKGLQLSCPSCRNANRKSLAKVRKGVERLVADHPKLPITATLEAWLGQLP